MNKELQIKYVKSAFELLKKLQGNHNIEDTVLIQETFDTILQIVSTNNQILNENTSYDKLLPQLSKDLISAAEKLVNDKLTAGISCGVKVEKGPTITIYRGKTSCLNNSVKIDKNTRFDLASVSKLFTSIHLLKNQEEKKINLSQKLHDYNNEYAIDKPMKEILTFNHVIQTNGRLNDNAKNEEEALEMLKQAKITEENTHMYSDMGYMMINKANPDVQDEFKEYFNEQMGLYNTGYEINENDITTGGNIQQLNKVHDPKAQLVSYAGHAGIFSTTEDLIKLYDALKKGFITKDSLKQIITPTLDRKYLTEDGQYLADTNGHAKLDKNGNKIPVTRGMEYRRHELGYAKTEVHECQSDLAFAAAGFTGTFACYDLDHEITTNILTNPISNSEDGKKPQGYAWKLDDLKTEELKLAYALKLINKLYTDEYQKEIQDQDKVYSL